MRFISTLALVALTCVSLAAQSAPCSTLTVTGTLAPGQTLSLDLAGATANRLALLAIGENAGSTTLSFGMLGTLTLDLDSPFLILPMGLTDTNGDVSRSFSIPASANPTIPSVTLNLQAVTVDFSFNFAGPPSLNFCVSNSATLVL